MNEQLKSFLDGEMDSVNSIEFEKLLGETPSLLNEAEDFRLLSATLKTVDSGTPYGMEELQAKLNSKQTIQASNKSLWRRAWLFSGSMVGALLVLAIMFPVFAQSKSAAKRTQLLALQGRGQSSADSAAMPVAPMLGDSEMTKSPSAGVTSADATVESAPVAASPMVEVKSMPGENGKVEFERNMSQLQASPSSTPPVVGPPDTPVGIYVERQGDIQVKVDNLLQAVDLVTGIAKTLDGFIVSSNVSRKEDGGEAVVVFRVPTSNFATAMTKLQQTGEVLSLNNSSQDITGETVDNTSRMFSWADEEQRLIEKLKKAKGNDKWRIRAELNQVRANLEAYRASVKSLRDRAKYSTITANFVSGDTGTGNSSWAKDSLKGATGGLSEIGRILGSITIYVLVLSPIWLPFVIVGLIIRSRNRG